MHDQANEGRPYLSPHRLGRCVGDLGSRLAARSVGHWSQGSSSRRGWRLRARAGRTDRASRCHTGRIRGLRPATRFRHAWPYYLVAWLLPLPVVGVIVALALLSGLSQAPLTLSPALVIGAIIGTLVSAPLFIGEELGWRGYLQLRLFGGRLLPAALLTGLIWGIFHWPLILIGYEGYENVLLGLAVFPVFTMLYSLLLGWLRARSGSLWVACLGHAAANGSGGALTAALFLHSGHFILLSYAGVFAWVPLGVLCVLLLLSGQFRLSAPPLAYSTLSTNAGHEEDGAAVAAASHRMA